MRCPKKISIGTCISIFNSNSISDLQLAQEFPTIPFFSALPCRSVAKTVSIRVRGAADHLAKRDGYFLKPEFRGLHGPLRQSVAYRGPRSGK